ncbi:MAG: lysophospholipid acyltransferase family protein [Planctomycetia bacterium]|nr:lysophospholipid acyltransferase family protein [Planctomycetia bacterium]
MSEQRSQPLVDENPKQRNWVWRTIQIVLQLLFSLFLRYRAHGHRELEQHSGMLFLINHQSFLDPLLVGLPLSRPVCFLARDSLFRVPVVGWVLRSTYVMPINRESASTAVMRQSIAKLRAGYWLGIFPEGTRSVDGQLGELKPGFLAIVRRAQVPVCVVGIDGSQRAYGRGALFPRIAKVSVYFDTPIMPDELKTLLERGEEHLLNQIRSRLEAAMSNAVSRN